MGTGTLQETIDSAFREEGALELRTSTEELYFLDPQHQKEEELKMQQQQEEQLKQVNECIAFALRSLILWKTTRVQVRGVMNIDSIQIQIQIQIHAKYIKQ